MTLLEKLGFTGAAEVQALTADCKQEAAPTIKPDRIPYYDRFREKVLAQQREYYRKNRKRISERNNAYRRANQAKAGS